jgi:LacI family transcriptional regulator/LacI family repressor for deo operon, udp, cdd, tsx, nupC, and nupG
MLDPTLIINPEANNDLERGRAGLELALQTEATAVFCYNDVIAIGLLMACRQQSIAVPDQLSVVGFDNIEPALYVAPPLTTVAQPRLKLGQLAMEMTLELLDGQEVQDQILPCELVKRQSASKPKIN